MVKMTHWPDYSIPVPADFTLDRVKKILSNLGNPHQNLSPIIHVAGTNGKGSIIAFLSSIFNQGKYKTHILTSPHIHHCNERILIDGEMISDNYLYELLEEIRENSHDIPIVFCEAMTIAAILAFSRNKADICLIETGMGGRIDETNVFEDKLLTILTPISYDHQEFLGDDISKIASEKSHIMRKDTISIIGPQPLDAKKMIEFRSAEIGNKLYHYGEDYSIEINEDDNFDFCFLDKIIKNIPKPSLEGEHQYINSSIAIAGICAIQRFYNKFKKINENNIKNGIKLAKNPQRLEKIEKNSIKKLLNNEKSELYIDGAHNIGGFYALSKWFKEKIIKDYEDNEEKRNYLIVGFTKNKSKSDFFTFFEDFIDFICPIRVKGEPNPEESEIISKNIKNIPNQTKEDLFNAIDFLSNFDNKNSCRIVICGSFYLGRDLRKL